MNQQTLENILSSVQGAASHPAGFVAMSKGSFDELASPPQQFLSIPAAHPLTVLINRLLLAPLAFPVSLAGLFLLRAISANFEFLELLKSFAAMVALVRNKFFNPGYVDLGFLFRMQLCFSID